MTDGMRSVIGQYATILTDGTGTDHADIAAEWAGEGFTPDEVAEWAKVRCFNAWSAAMLRDAGVSPDDVATVTGGGPGEYADTIGYKFANGDVSVGEVLAGRR